MPQSGIKLTAICSEKENNSKANIHFVNTMCLIFLCYTVVLTITVMKPKGLL